MNIKIIENKKSEGKLIFSLSKSSTYFINAIRRTVIEEVPTIAIEDVEFKKNSSPLYDEVVAHRLGLIPLVTDLKSYNLPAECKCEGAGCARCQVKFKLKDSKSGIVYASKLKGTDPKIVPAYEQTPILTLLEGQELQLEATAVLGKGKEHSKWTPGLMFYYQVPKIELKSNDKAKEVASKYGFFELRGNKLSINEDKYAPYNQIEAGLEQLPKGSYTLEHEQDSFIVYVESFGQLDCKTMLTRAAEEIETQLDDFSEKLKAL